MGDTSVTPQARFASICTTLPCHSSLRERPHMSPRVSSLFFLWDFQVDGFSTTANSCRAVHPHAMPPGLRDGCRGVEFSSDCVFSFHEATGGAAVPVECQARGAAPG